MPRPVSQRQPADRTKLRYSLAEDLAELELGDASAVNMLIAKAGCAKYSHDAELFARAALTVAQAISQQQFNNAKAKRRG